MRKTVDAEDLGARLHSFSEVGEFAPITVREEIKPEAIAAPADEPVVLDRMVASIKWIFLFLSGTAAIHFMMMAFALLFFYNDWSPEPMIGSLGIMIVSSFMIMLGVGKLRDLKYLKVVGGIVAAGAMAAICYSILITFIPGDFFGWFSLLTLPFTVLMGHLVKRKIDAEDGPASQ